MSKGCWDGIKDLETAKQLIDVLAEENVRLKEESEAFESETMFWELFFHETIRLFGNKRSGTLQLMLKKAMTHLQVECRARANNPKKNTKENNELAGEKEGGFNVKKFMEYADKKMLGEFSKTYPSTVKAKYLLLTVDHGEAGLVIGFAPPMDKSEAISLLAEQYKFPSVEACYQHLKRAGVKGLPSTWPKV